jgi:uncharacterized protein YbjT (DUF2867 family)
MRILVTGASGFVGSTLALRLHAEGHRVRAFGRDPARLHAALEHPRRGDVAAIEMLGGDVLTGAGLARALDGVEVAYYLIHSMESPIESPSPQVGGGVAGIGPERPAAARASREDPFWERERLAAQTFGAQARRAGVRRIVYLGGLLPRGSVASRHLASRAEVQDILLASIPDSVALRASIVIGARSRSFRLLVRLIERLPVLALPPWRRFHTQPIDIRDVTEMLLAAAAVDAAAGRSLDIGGPEALTYEEILRRIAELMLVRRPLLGLKAAMTPLTGRLAAAVAGEDPALTVALMEGLQGDLLPADDRAASLLGVQLHSFDAAVECALGEWEAVEPLAAR